MSDVRTGKPTCSSCPFFLRPRGGPVAVDATGQCLYGRSIPVPMGANAGGGLLIGTMRPPTTHDMTCADHPMMKGWLERTYGTKVMGMDLADGVDGSTIRVGNRTVRLKDEPIGPKGEPERHAREAPDPREREDETAREREMEQERYREEDQEDAEADRRRDAHQITKLRLTDG